MIERLELINFTVFNKIQINFSPKINVIIGENGTGKTHLLKAAYALCAGAPLYKNNPDTSNEDLIAAMTNKLLRLFMPIDDKLGKLRRHGVAENAQLAALFSLDKKIELSFHTNSRSIAIQNQKNYSNNLEEAVYIPTKEVLSFMKGFISLYERYGLSFDQTYQDICLLLDLPEVRLETLNLKSKWAMSEIERVCGGRFIFYGGGKVTFKTEDNEYSANSMAEGFRKAGMLARLLETGAIQPGVTGPLFWDEPETNLNPKLMKLLVQILLELSRNGQQIILATHDYILLKWFDLLVKTGLGDHIMYHALSVENDQVFIQSTDDYRHLNNNAIANTFADLYDEEIKRSLGSAQ